MSNRRDFLRTAGTAAGMLMLGGTASTFAQTARREPMLGGRRIRTVDIHAHCVFPAAADLIAGTRLLGIGFPGSQVLGPRRLDAMNERGIDYQALSVNRYWWYEADRDLARRVVRLHDEAIAEWCNAHPDRFVGLSSVALQYPDLAAEQLEYAVKELGLRGASVGGHVMGEPPTAEKYDPFWAKAEELGVTTFMHPDGSKNVIKDGGLDGRGDLGNIIGNPLETTVFLTHMIFDGTLDRFPNLQICAAHAGGFLPSYLGRTEVACEVRNDAECLNTKHPSEYLKNQILVDSMVFSHEGLRHLVAEMGASQVVYGTDIPFNWPDTLDLILDADYLSTAEKTAIAGGTLSKLLRIT